MVTCLSKSKRKPPVGAGFSGEPPVLPALSEVEGSTVEGGTFSYQQIHAHKPLFGKQGKVMKISICNLWSINNAGRPGLNRRATSHERRATNSPFTSVEDSLQISLFMQNKANFLDTQMNVSTLITVYYENIANSKLSKNKPNSNPIKANTKPIKANKMPKQTQYKPNLLNAQMNVNKVLTKDYENKPRLTAPAKQTQSNPISKQLQSPIFPGHLLINRMNRICCVCSSTISFDSAKMALYTDNWNLKKDGRKKLNFLKCKRLNSPGWLRPLTGTLFAQYNVGKTVLTNS